MSMDNYRRYVRGIKDFKILARDRETSQLLQLPRKTFTRRTIPMFHLLLLAAKELKSYRLQLAEELDHNTYESLDCEG